MGLDRDAIITEARVVIARKWSFEESAVFAKLEGYDEEVKLIVFFPDEIMFTPNELIGLTVEQARKLHGKKDRDYLVS